MRSRISPVIHSFLPAGFSFFNMSIEGSNTADLIPYHFSFMFLQFRYSSLLSSVSRFLFILVCSSFCISWFFKCSIFNRVYFVKLSCKIAVYLRL